MIHRILDSKADSNPRSKADPNPHKTPLPHNLQQPRFPDAHRSYNTQEVVAPCYMRCRKRLVTAYAPPPSTTFTGIGCAALRRR